MPNFNRYTYSAPDRLFQASSHSVGLGITIQEALAVFPTPTRAPFYLVALDTHSLRFYPEIQSLQEPVRLGYYFLVSQEDAWAGRAVLPYWIKKYLQNHNLQLENLIPFGDVSFTPDLTEPDPWSTE